MTPNRLEGGEGLRAGAVAIFCCSFNCESADAAGLRMEGATCICELMGGALYSYEIAAQISNLAVDVSP